jgi:uncharacterized protein (DUF1501 family)
MTRSDPIQSRRSFLENAVLLALVGVLPTGCATAPRTGASASLENTLVLVELNGGNDGLNTVVPFADPLYAKLRPNLALGSDAVVKIDERTGLHPGLAPLMGAWRDGQLGIVQGVGYERPNLSHFRSIEIWESASDSEQILPDGWLARVLATQPGAARRPAEGAVFGRPAIGPLLGANSRAVLMDGVQGFASRASKIDAPAAAMPSNPALAHVVRTQAEIALAGDMISDRLRLSPVRIKTPFPKNGFGGQMSNAARLIAARVDVPVIKVSLGSFDTHTYQKGTHDRLMGELGAGLAAFRAAMMETGDWRRVTVMTYSEFGRRAKENSAQGTDHGTAAPHFIMGPAIAGGLHGQAPSLAKLSDGNLMHHVDFRDLYASVMKQWWNIDPRQTLNRSGADLRLFA